MAAIRPANFNSFVGQRKTCSQLGVSISAAQRRGEPLDHCLFSGPAGLGKTTLCNIINDAMGGRFFTTNGGVMRKPSDLIGTLVRLEIGDYLFIDEIHRIPMVVEECLYTAMEDFYIDSMASNGTAVRLDLNHFTIIGATTREGMLTKPLLDRFGITCRLELYPPSDLVTIVMSAAQNRKHPIRLTQEAARYLAERARGTPRLVLKLLDRANDYVVWAPMLSEKGIGGVDLGLLDLGVAEVAMKALSITEFGLTPTDVSVLRALAICSRPLGLATLAVVANEAKDTIEEVLEPHMIRLGLIDRTAKGRVITDAGKQYLQRLDTPKDD
tara:strand:+ start:208 stop:1188 length:981 start_codon:yes stop_codon:yes gene_type:complete